MSDDTPRCQHHHRSMTCSCSISALEPSDTCRVHSGGEWPPKCDLCGQFMSRAQPAAPPAAPQEDDKRMGEGGMTDETKPTPGPLLPCPFCGGEPLVEDFEPHLHELVSLPEFPGTRCIECPACEFRIFDEDPATAHAKWNRRAPALAARVAALEAALWELVRVHTGPKLNDEGPSYRAVKAARALLEAK